MLALSRKVENRATYVTEGLTLNTASDAFSLNEVKKQKKTLLLIQRPYTLVRANLRSSLPVSWDPF